jgi:hypothetical protein
MINARPAQKSARPPRRRNHSIATHAATAITAKNQRCQPPPPARKLNAAPRLKASTRLANGVSGNSSPARNDARIKCLVSWSSTMTSTASHSQRKFA